MMTVTVTKDIAVKKTTLVIDNITVGYNQQEIILKDLKLDFTGPGLIQILGPNGAGKSTLLKTITGLIKPLKGRILVNNKDITGDPEEASKYIGYVPQLTFTGEISNYPITVWEILENEYKFRTKKWPRLFVSKEEKKVIIKALEKSGLPREVWKENFWNLSGGQKQRVLIARAILHEPPIILMDEPLSAIDPRGKAELTKIINELSKKNLVIVTSHDPMMLLKYTDKIVLLNRNTYIVGTPSEVLTEENAKKVYGEAAIKVGKDHVHIADLVCHK